MPIKAEDLIAAKKDSFNMPCDEPLDELKKILEHNDGIGNYLARGYISSEATRELLASWGYKCSRDRLNEICKKLGRKNFQHA